MSVLQKIIAMLFLKAAPQDLPYAKQLAIRSGFIYWFSGMLVLNTTLAPPELPESMLLSVVILLVFVYLVLRAFNLQLRFVQTFTAVVGVGALFNIASWPILALVANQTATDSGEVGSLAVSVSFVFLMLLSWELLVKAHIFKHAMEISMMNALLLSFALFFISMTLSQMLFPS